MILGKRQSDIVGIAGGAVICLVLFLVYPELNTFFGIVPYTPADWGLLALFIAIPLAIQLYGGGIMSSGVANALAVFGVYSHNYLLESSDFIVFPGGQRLLFTIALSLAVGFAFSVVIYGFRWLFDSFRGSTRPDSSV